jgi:carbon monoxide dehydrogenase subunit G
MRSNSLRVDLAINAPAQKVWDFIADWEGQSAWMLQTKVFLTSEKSEGVGVTIEAFTGPLYRIYPRAKFLGVLDLMKVTRWEPPRRCDVLHYGSIIKGTGTFEVEAVDANSSIFHWSEEIEAPWLLFVLIRPFILAGVRISLARFRRLLE